MTARGLVALDIDGTILLEDETLSDGVVDAVARLRDSGYEVMLATGRSWAATERYVTRLGIEPAFVVCSNGAVTLRRTDAGYERWNIETFDASAVLELLNERLPDAHYMVELASGRRLFTRQLEGWPLDAGEQVTFAQLSAAPVSRVVVVSPGHDEADFHRLVAEAGLNEVSYAIGWTAWLDIAPLGVDKGTALARVRDELGISGADVLVAGDGRNDIGMFTWALGIGGRAVAMGQAPDEVKQAAGEQTASVDAGGLARVLNALADQAVPAGE